MCPHGKLSFIRAYLARQVRPTFKQAFLDPDLVEMAFEKFVLHELKGGVKQTFSQIDADGSGTIDANEIRALLSALGHTVVSQPMVDAIIGKLDANGDGIITEAEFEAWYVERVQVMTNPNPNPNP